MPEREELSDVERLGEGEDMEVVMESLAGEIERPASPAAAAPPAAGLLDASDLAPASGRI